MTKLSLSIIVFLFFSNHSIAQQHKTFGYGIKAGLNYTVANETSNDFNFYAGAFLHLAISDEFKIQPEILYSKYNSISVLDKDVKVKYYNTGRILTIASGDEYKVSESTLQLPVMIQYHFSRKLYGEIGPQVIYLFDRKIDFTEESLFPPGWRNYNNT